MSRISFYSDDFKIFGNLNLPNKKSPCIVCLHGLEGNKDNSKWKIFSKSLVKNGYGCLRFNFRGCGIGNEKSEGNFEDISLTARLNDYRSSVDFLEDSVGVDSDRIGAVGSSFGGVISLVSRDLRIKAISTLSSPAKVPQFQEKIIPLEEDDFYVLPSGRRFKKSFYSDLKKYDILSSVKKSPPLLIIHGSLDNVVSVSHAKSIFRNASRPKKLVIIKGADHFFSEKDHLNRVIDTSISWFNEHFLG